MGKQKQLTPQQIKEREEMRAFMEQNKNTVPLKTEAKTDPVSFVGGVNSTRDVINAENALEDFRDLEDLNAQGGNVSPFDFVKEDFDNEFDSMLKQNNDQIKFEPKNEVEKISMDTDEQSYKELKELKAQRDELLKKDTPLKRILNDAADQNFEKDGNIFSKAGDYAMGGLYNLIAFPINDTYGMSDENASELTRLNEEIYKRSVEPLRKMKRDILNKQEGIVGKWGAWEESEEGQGELSSTRADYRIAVRELDEQLEKIDAILEKKDGWDSVMDNMDAELGSVGLYSFYTGLFHKLPIAKKQEAINRRNSLQQKVESGEATRQDLDELSSLSNIPELHESEEALLEVMGITNDVAQSTTDLNPSYWYRTVDGTLDSAVFMAQIAATGGIGATSKKVGVKAANMALQAALMPNSYSAMAEKYIGIVENEYNEDGSIKNIYLRDSLYNKYKHETEVVKQADENKRKELLAKGNLNDEEKGELEILEGKLGIKDVKGVESYDSFLEKMKPESALASVRKGYVGTLNELFVEKVGGKYIDKVLGKAKLPGFGFMNKGKLGVVKRGILEQSKKIANATGLNSIPSEYLEELLVAPLNSLNEGNLDEIKALGNASTHIDILGQTALMGTVGGTASTGLYALNRQKNLNRQRKELREKFKNIAELNDEELSNFIALKTTNTDFTTSDYKYEIQNLRNKGEEEMANQLEEKMFYNLGLKSFKNGTSKQFNKSLTKLLSKPDLKPETRGNIMKAKVNIDKLNKAHKKFSKLPNSKELMNLEANKIAADNSIAEIDQSISDISDSLKQSVEAYADSRNFDKALLPHNIGELFTNKVEDEAQQGLYNDFVDKLDGEGFAEVEYLKNLTLARQEISRIWQESINEQNKRSSNNFQNDLKDNSEFQNRLVSDEVLMNSIKEGNEKDFNDQFEKIAKKYGTKLSKKAKEQFKDQFEQALNLNKLREEANKKEVIQQKVEEIKEEEIPVETAEAKVEPEKGIEDAETDKINKALNQQFSQDAESLKDSFRTNNEGGIVVDQDSFFDLPKQLSDNLSDDQKENIKSRIGSMYNTLNQQTGSKPDFKALVNKFIDTTSLEQADEYYNVLSLGWELNNLPQTDFKKAYNKIFDPFKSLAEELIGDTSVFGPTTHTELDESNSKIINKIEKANAPIIGYTEQNVPIRKSEGLKTVTPDLKLGFLSMLYKEEVNQEGVVEKRTLSNELNSDGVVDFKDLLNPDMYNKGSKLFVSVPPEATLNQIYISSRNSQGEQTSELYTDWLSRNLKQDSNFKNTEAYISKVPVLAYSTQGKPLAYIHDVDWYNPYNIGFSDNLPKQAEIIQNGREQVLELRKRILNDNLKTVEVTSKKGSVFHKVPSDQPALPISEANPQSTITIAKNRGQLYQGEDAFETKNKVIINKDDIVKGHTYDVRRIGLDEEGRKTFMAFEVLRGDETNDYKLDRNTYNTVKWALASFLKKNKFDSYFKGKDFQLTEEKADEVVQKVFNTTGYDISQRDDLYRFMKQYILFENLDYKTLSDKLFNPDEEVGKDFQQHTSNSALGTNPSMVVISPEGEVTPSGKKYKDYLKDSLRTNVKSFNVGTQEKPVYATAIQPSINYTFDTQETEQTPTLKEVVSQAVQEVKEQLEDSTDPNNVFDKASSLLNNLGFGTEQSFDDLPIEIKDISKVQEIFNTTEGLTVIQEYQLIDFIFNKITNSVDIKYKSQISRDQLLDEIKNSYNEIVKPSKTEVESILTQITGLYNGDPVRYEKLGKLINEYNKALEVYSTIESNWSNIESKSLEKLYKYTGIKEGKLDENVDTSLREKNYSKTSLEENGKDKTSYKLRRFFAGIEQKTPQGETKKGFLNLPTYVGFNDVYNTVAQILSSPVEIESNFDLMIDKLSQAQDTHKWIPSLIERLQEADDQIKKEFVYNYTKHTLSMKFSMYSVDGNGKYSLKVFDTNANEITRLIKNTWRNNLIATPLVNSNQEFYSINKVHAQNLLDQFESWGNEAHMVDKTKVKAWLNNFGINLSKDAFNELSTKGIFYRGENISYKDMFEGNDTVFGLLHKYLKDIVNVDNTEFEENENNHPFTDMSGVLQALSILESKYTNQSMTLSFRDNGKSIFGLTPNKFATDRVLALKQYNDEGVNEFVNDLQSLSMSSQSYMLDLLQTEADFRNKFNIDHVGITSLKQQGKKSSPFSNVTDLNSIDHDVAKMTGFQDTKQGNVNATVDRNGKIQKGGNGISMRMGRMFLPTMSDKSQMLMLNTGVFNLLKDKRKSFETTPEGEVFFTETLSNLLYNQIVRPELKRIIKFHNSIKNTNIKDYDLAAQIFNFIPELNNVKDENGIRLIELIASNPNVFHENWVEENFKQSINEVVSKVIDEKVNAKMSLWETALERDNSDNIKNIKFFDNTYLSESTGSLDEKFRLGMYDYVINSFITNANMFTILAGDPAIYAQNKLFSGFGVDNIKIAEIASLYGKENMFSLYNNHKSFMSDINELYSNGSISKKLYSDLKSKIKPLPYSAEDKAYSELSEKVGVNIGKRLALLIAPGNKIANSKGQKYMQVFLEDAVHISENTEYLIDLYYGREKLNSVKNTLENYRNSTNESEKAQIRKDLSNKFPDLADYFDIESTDAQEYTTVSEHINVLENQGRIPDEVLNSIKEKISKGEDLNKKEIGFVLQPIKPVHTGQIVDKQQDVLRTVYVKSSSFPLLPQLTKGREIDNLRLKLEELEQKNNMPVRASYQTANKVGAMNNAINPFSEEGLNNAEASSLVLDRDNFRIQQDVPFKSDLKKEDKVSMGTQIFKLLFGDGMLNQKGFNIDGREMSGRELYDHFNDSFSKSIALKKKGLYRELGLNEEGVPVDQKKSMEKLQNLLQREAKDRGYPRQDVEGLTFVEKKDINGDTYFDFKLPLWISSNSNRYEALLNAIVTNRIISQKLPGNSFVVGSEEGFQVKEDMSGINKSKVIHIGDYQGGELQGVKLSNGQFQKAQMLIPSKFKDANGQLIDLYQKKNGVYTYLNVGENGELRLKEDMIDKDLLTNFTFRTPTSSHVSASVVEIVGILPPESGDLMIVPKNFTKQKGLDYDVDKETAYQLWNIQTPSGKIEVLNESHRAEAIKGLRARLESAKQDNSYDRIMRAMFGEEYDSVLEDEVSSIQDKIDRISDKFDQKILENEFIKTHIAVFSNSNREVQKKINKVLSMDFAKSQAEMIEGLNKTGQDNTNFSILSDEYQKQKMALGAAGKLAIGVYSNYVTFHGLTQQVENKLYLKEQGVEGDPVNKYFTIGNMSSNGLIGNETTLDGSRSIAEAFAEKQNTATDNEKEQVLGRVNVNGITINVDSLLTLLGFDKGEQVNGQDTSIPYLFLSQPIIKDYVELMQASQAITADYNHNREQIVMDALINKYSEDFKVDQSSEILSEEQFDKLIKELNSTNMVEAITTKGKNIPGLQLAALQQFLELDKYAKQIGSIQSVLNTTNLGKSIVESNEKYDKLSKLSGNVLVGNAHRLVGDFIPAEAYNNEEGYQRVADYFIKPSTPQGQIVVNGIKTGNDLWNEYFPYSDENIKQVTDEILEITNGSEKSDSKRIELKFDIFKEIKRYINSHNKNGIFTEKATTERRRLFIDSPNNSSLATYLNKVKLSELKNVEKDNKPGVFNLKRNKLFSKFEFTLNTNGEPSLVRFNNATSENFDEDYLYTAIAEMIINNESLPNYNGEPYNTRKLASDLVAYTYLEGGVQEAIQFTKYVPIEYLEAIGFTDILQNYSPKRDSSIFKRVLGIKQISDINSHDTHKFVKQYIQHNPQMAKQFNPGEEVKLFKNKVFNGKKLESFTLTTEEQPKFISRKNKTKSKRNQDKFSLYQNTGNGQYQRISVLGIHGMNEYELGNDNVVSLLENVEPSQPKVAAQRVIPTQTKQVNDQFNIKGGNVSEILSNIGNFKGKKYQHFGKLSEFLSDFVKPEVNVRIDDTEKLNGIKASGRTIYNNDGSIDIIIDSDVMASNDHEQIARTFVHEFIHSVTVKELDKYFDKKTGEQKVKQLPLHVSRLLRVFNETKKQLGPELEALLDKRRKHLQGDLPSSTSYSAEELEVTYGATSIFEFVTTALTEPEFQKRMSEVEFKKSGETIWDRFKKAVMNILFSNSININKDSVGYEALSSILDFIDTENTTKSNKNSTFEKSKQNDFDEGYLKQIEAELNQKPDKGNFDLPAEMLARLPEICD